LLPYLKQNCGFGHPCKNIPVTFFNKNAPVSDLGHEARSEGHSEVRYAEPHLLVWLGARVPIAGPKYGTFEKKLAEVKIVRTVRIGI
jgi:hypothetical protein